MAAEGPGDAPVLLAGPVTTAAAPGRLSGQAWVEAITGGATPGGARLASVWSVPCARTAWYLHARGQTLHVASGRGLVQAAGGAPLSLAPGSTVWTSPGSGTGTARCPGPPAAATG